MRKTALSAVALACVVNLALVSPAAADTLTLISSMDGASVPSGGDPDGEGSFQATVNTATNTLCYQLRTSNISNRTKAHIHEGGAGEPGRPLVELSIQDGECTTVDSDTLQAMIANPQNYYVDVLTANYKIGAIRGQLALSN